MLLPALCLLNLLAAPIQDSPRLKTELANGVIVLVENNPDAKICSVQLLAGARGLDEMLATHGRRHLLEHLLVKGADGKLDQRLETLGMSLTAQTFRDAMQIGIEGSNAQVGEALKTLRGFVPDRAYSEADIAKESAILGEELALETDARRLSAAAWRAAYGENGLDPDGNPEGLPKTSPAELRALHKAQFATPNLVVVVSGAVGLDETTRQVSSIFGDLPELPQTPWQTRQPLKPATADAPDAEGEALAAPVPSLTEPRTAWALAAALAVASETREAFVTYTPTIRRGLIILGTESASKGIVEAFQRDFVLDEPRLCELGRKLGLRWVSGKLDSPAGSAFWRGYLYAQAVGTNLEAISENLKTMTQAQFREGLAMFRPDRAALVEGTWEPPLNPLNAKGPEGLGTPERLGGSAGACIESPDPSASEVSIEAVVRLPYRSQKALAAAQVLAKAIPLGNALYSEAQIRRICSQTGRPLQVSAMPDHIRISLCLPPKDLEIGVSVLAAMLKQEAFTDAQIVRAQDSAPQPKTILERALWPSVLAPGKVTRAEIEQVYEASFRPDNVALAFSGRFEPGIPARLWEARLEGWTPVKVPTFSGDSTLGEDWRSHRRSVATIELAAPEFPGSDVSLPTRLLAVFALGVGKGSSLFRVIREREGWSYRQEAFLWPTPSGFRPRIVLATTQGSDRVDAKKVREALLADVKTWTQADLDRAIGMTETSLVTHIVPVPLYLTPTGPAGDDPASRAFLGAYLRQKTGLPFDAAKTLALMRLVRLEELKETATQMLERSIPRVIPGAAR